MIEITLLPGGKPSVTGLSMLTKLGDMTEAIPAVVKGVKESNPMESEAEIPLWQCVT